MEPLSRTNEEYYVMGIIYNLIGDMNFSEPRNIKEIMIGVTQRPFDEISDFIKSLVRASMNNFNKIVEAYRPSLKNWTWDRLPELTRAILVMSYAQYYLLEEKFDKKIIINTAVNFAKKYVEPKQGKFVNAILDGVLA